MPASPAGGPPARADDITALRTLLGESRLVTVTGPPGSGKSALAAAATAGLAGRFADGTLTVPLRAVADGALVPHAVARALRLPDPLRLSQLAALRSGLRGKRLLIVLDDCDRVADACAALAAELTRCPGVHLTTTAMAPLRAAGERVYPLAGSARPADRAAFGLAHQLCPPRQRLLWARLSVFADWFAAADAVAVCAHPPLPAPAVPGALTDLAARSVLSAWGKPARPAPGTGSRRRPATTGRRCCASSNRSPRPAAQARDMTDWSSRIPTNAAISRQFAMRTFAAMHETARRR